MAKAPPIPLEQLLSRWSAPLRTTPRLKVDWVNANWPDMHPDARAWVDVSSRLRVSISISEDVQLERPSWPRFTTSRPFCELVAWSRKNDSIGMPIAYVLSDSYPLGAGGELGLNAIHMPSSAVLTFSQEEPLALVRELAPTLRALLETAAGLRKAPRNERRVQRQFHRSWVVELLQSASVENALMQRKSARRERVPSLKALPREPGRLIRWAFEALAAKDERGFARVVAQSRSLGGPVLADAIALAFEVAEGKKLPVPIAGARELALG